MKDLKEKMESKVVAWAGGKWNEKQLNWKGKASSFPSVAYNARTHQCTQWQIHRLFMYEMVRCCCNHCVLCGTNACQMNRGGTPSFALQAHSEPRPIASNEFAQYETGNANERETTVWVVECRSLDCAHSTHSVQPTRWVKSAIEPMWMGNERSRNRQAAS